MNLIVLKTIFQDWKPKFPKEETRKGISNAQLSTQ